VAPLIHSRRLRGPGAMLASLLVSVLVVLGATVPLRLQKERIGELEEHLEAARRPQVNTPIFELPEVILVLADNKTHLRGQEMCDAVDAVKTADPVGFSAKTWTELVALSGDPVNAPAKPTPVWELFWDMKYNVNGLFVSDPVTRVNLYPPSGEGGFANNPDTKYLSSVYSLGFGSVFVIQGKMPTHPLTSRGQREWIQDTEVRYWSACTSGAPPSGRPARAPRRAAWPHGVGRSG
jgi:hypothetical protein